MSGKLRQNFPNKKLITKQLKLNTMERQDYLYNLTAEIGEKLNNEIEYQLTRDEYYKIRNQEYQKLVDEDKIKDTDDNHDDFDSYLGDLLNVNWG
jgi:hypothetical protein